MEELNYNELKSEVVEILEKAGEIVFATSADNKVTARTMCHINIGLTIMFGTNKNSEKIAQITKNENVALVTGNIQIEAVAKLAGHPNALPEYTKKYIEKFPHLGDIYPSTPDDVVVSIESTKISLFKFIDGPCSDILDIKNNKAYRIGL